MPTFTSMAWETLLEPRSDDDKSQTTKPRVPPKHIYISPPLYATPEPTPIPYYSSDPPSPSPYVLNYKRRGPLDPPPEGQRRESGDGGPGEGFGGGNEVDVVGADDDVVEFLDPRVVDAVSISGSVDGIERSSVSNQGEFFDADDEFFSDGSTPCLSSRGTRFESELLATKLSLLDETEKRKSAEEVVQQMYQQWQRLGNLLSQNGLSLPPPPNAISRHLDFDSLEQLSQELVVTRFVAEAIGKAEARDEAELNAEAVIQSKDQEILRLRDRLRYYEAVNHEMSQRNQEVMEIARRQRQRKKSQRRWLWSCLGISMIVGSSVIAYTFLPQSSKSQALPSPSCSADASCMTSE